MSDPKILCIIPARKGSKRLPEKNTKIIHGKPLVAWTIEKALQVKSFAKVLVSTDDEQILAIAKSYGLETPFVRPEELSQDSTSSFEVAKHALEFLKEKQGEDYDYIALLQPTSPLRKAGSVESVVQLLMEKNAKAVVSVTACEHSPLWSNTIGEDLSLTHFLRDEVKNKRSQDLPSYYRINGAIYICSVKEFLSQKTFFISEDIYAFKMSQEESVDIDTEIDFLTAEVIMKRFGY